MIKKNLRIKILDKQKINEMGSIVDTFGKIYMNASSNMYSTKKPLTPGELFYEGIVFYLEAASNEILKSKLYDLINALDNVSDSYLLKDLDSKETIVAPNKFIGVVLVKFDNLKYIKRGTYQKLDKLKSLRTSFGYCRCKKPEFRPIETMSIEILNIYPETIYLISNSSHNLEKLKEFISIKINEIEPKLEIEFRSIK